MEGVLRAAVRSIVDVNHLLYLVQAACQPYDAHNARHEQRLLRVSHRRQPRTLAPPHHLTASPHRITSPHHHRTT